MKIQSEKSPGKKKKKNPQIKEKWIKMTWMTKKVEHTFIRFQRQRRERMIYIWRNHGLERMKERNSQIEKEN